MRLDPIDVKTKSVFETNAAASQAIIGARL